LGAAQNALELRSSSLANTGDVNAQAKSRILDADYTVETAGLVSSNILQSSGIAMIAQSNVSCSRRILAQLMRAI
jgi:flagellin